MAEVLKPQLDENLLALCVHDVEFEVQTTAEEW